MNQKATIKQLVIALALVVLPFLGFGQGFTTSSMNGRVLDNSGQPLVGATVIATHTPTGSKYGNTSNGEGFFRIPNMRVGGPYTVEVTYVGFENYKQEGIFLTLGQAYQLKVAMSATGVTTDVVEITSSKSDVFDGNRTGAETVITEGMINALPTVSRAIGDFARLTPQATVREGGDGFSISINGMNNRYNAIYIDGAVNNDVFGLAGSGTNGGQTGVSPFPIDAIETFQIQVAPFDIRVGGFAGGAINAVTRSGSNNLEASVYGFTANQNLAGLTPTDDESRERVALPDFTSNIAGFRIGGPIVKDKVFFFLNAELQRDETPQPFNFADYEGDASIDDVNRLISAIQGYGYEPGTYTDNRSFLNSDKINVKFDFNLNDNNKLSIRHGYVRAENLEGVTSNSTRLRFLNESEYFVSTTNSTAIELNTVVNEKMSNNLKVGLTFVRDDRDPFQGDEFSDRSEDEDPNYFPYVTVFDGRGRFTFGSEQFSTANALDQDVITLTDNFEIYNGRHTFTIGTHNEFYSIYNLFIRQNYGVYEFANIDSFVNGAPSEFFRSYSLVDDITGDGSAAASEFSGAQFGLYFQDEYQATDNFKVTAGIRFDLPLYFTNTPQNEDFNTNTVPAIEAQGYDLLGAQTGTFIDPQLLISPRIGFNWDVTGEKRTQLRGGIGIFTSRIPLVWPGGAFNNNGAIVGGDFTTEPTTDWFRNYDGTFNPQWNNQPQAVQAGAGQPSGQIDLFAENFKVPRFLKANLALDQKLGNGFVLNVDGMFNKTIQNVFYQNINLKPAVDNLTGSGDTRPIFNRSDEIDDTYSRILLASNTTQGYTYNLSASVSKAFSNGLSGMVAYSYGDAFSIYDGTSSQNSSQWRGLHSTAAQGRNDLDQTLQRSDFAQGHRAIAGLSYVIDWLGTDASVGTKTTVSIFYEGITGQPYSYVYANGQNIQNEDSRNRMLIYVPTDANDINLVGTAEEQATQWANLDAFIESDPYLSTIRGQVAERNRNRAPFSNVIDLRLAQDVSFKAGDKRHTLQITADVFNLTNLLNKNWGRRYFVSSSFNLIEFEGMQDGTTNVPTFSFDPIDEGFPANNIDDAGVQSSRWQARLGVRYLFN
ncbi:MAG: carboxypeptidase regulatory-like domain-containing protein [Bacteroidota bacterium]